MKDKIGETGSPIQMLVKPVVAGALIGLSVMLILFVLIALLMSFGLLPLSSAAAAAGLSAAAGAFFAGWKAAKKLGKNGLIVGAICGLVLFLVFSLISMAAFRSTPSTSTLIRLVIFLCGAAIGGIIGVGSSNKRKIV